MGVGVVLGTGPLDPELVKCNGTPVTVMLVEGSNPGDVAGKRFLSLEVQSGFSGPRTKRTCCVVVLLVKQNLPHNMSGISRERNPAWIF